MSEEDHYYALLTGANSGLGFSIAVRLIDKFLLQYPASSKLTLTITTRSASKAASTITRLTSHLSSHDRAGRSASQRVTFSSATVDLTNIASVIALSRHLRKSHKKLDFIFLNAGMGAFLGVDWLICFYDLLTNWVEAVTYPRFKLQEIGCMKGQVNGESIAEVFCANVFGHYYLAHELMGLLSAGGGSDVAGRIIWTSSLEAYARTFDIRDLEGVRATHSYESSKRLNDILCLTASLPATAPYTRVFFSPPEDDPAETSPRLRRVGSYLSHPGICATSIIPLNFILFYCMALGFWVARMLGSPWHTLSSYSGANAAVWLALAPEDELRERDVERVKWGSGSDRWGNEVLRETPVEGGSGEEWEALGRDCWKRMEELRVRWKKRLDGL
ncbi:3-keto-steroid reductase [Rhizina undulata]